MRLASSPIVAALMLCWLGCSSSETDPVDGGSSTSPADAGPEDAAPPLRCSAPTTWVTEQVSDHFLIGADLTVGADDVVRALFTGDVSPSDYDDAVTLATKGPETSWDATRVTDRDGAQGEDQTLSVVVAAAGVTWMAVARNQNLPAEYDRRVELFELIDDVPTLRKTYAGLAHHRGLVADAAGSLWLARSEADDTVVISRLAPDDVDWVDVDQLSMSSDTGGPLRQLGQLLVGAEGELWLWLERDQGLEVRRRDPDGSWGAPEGVHGGPVDHVAMAASPSGTVWALYSTSSTPSTQDVHVRRREPTGGWADAESLGVGLGPDPDLAVAIDLDERPWVSFVQNAASTPLVLGHRNADSWEFEDVYAVTNPQYGAREELFIDSHNSLWMIYREASLEGPVMVRSRCITH